jgi:hypothetical protein
MAKTDSYKIIFDTNVLFSPKDLKSRGDFGLTGFLEFLKSNKLTNITLAVPDIVVREICQRRIEEAQIQITKIESAVQAMVGLTSIKPAHYLLKDYSKKIAEYSLKKLKELGLKILPIPTLDQEDFIRRAIKGEMPFAPRFKEVDGIRSRNKEDGDKGFKDCILWHTLLADAKSRKGVIYILCTSNHYDFDKDILTREFVKSCPHGRLEIKKDLIELQSFLDQDCVLELDLKRTYEDVKNELSKKLGEVMIQFHTLNSNLVLSTPLNIFDSYRSTLPYILEEGAQKDKEIPYGYDFENIEYVSISKMKDANTYRIEAELKMIPRSQSNMPNNTIIDSLVTGRGIYYSPYAKVLTSTFRVILSFNLSSKDIRLLAATEKSYY